MYYNYMQAYNDTDNLLLLFNKLIKFNVKYWIYIFFILYYIIVWKNQ